MSESKKTLRTEALRHRVMMDPRSEDPDEACDIFFDSIKPDKDRVVATYWPKDKEFDPYAILERLQKNGNVCGLPVVQKDTKELKFVRWSEDQPLEKGLYDVQQPVISENTEFIEPDIVIVPLLAFDRQGNRLGYGGGYYDATLKALRAKKDIVAVGVAYAQQACLFSLPVEEHDERLDWLITPKEAFCFE